LIQFRPQIASNGSIIKGGFALLLRKSCAPFNPMAVAADDLSIPLRRQLGESGGPPSEA
jgi:hypothetical protein